MWSVAWSSCRWAIRPDSFYGADRKGANLMPIRWSPRRSHRQDPLALSTDPSRHLRLRWDAPPALVEVNRGGTKTPAIAEITKSGLYVHSLDRLTGKPVFGVEERPVPERRAWRGCVAHSAFPIKPLPIARLTVKREEITRRTPQAERFCTEQFDAWCTAARTRRTA
jgi:quinoprotein glucose dehydrogenase